MGITNSFIKTTLLTNGVIDIMTGLALIFFPKQFTQILGFPEFPRDVNFIIGGWGIAALTFGVGRIMASKQEERYRLWALLGLLEGSLLFAFSLRYWLGGGLTFMQVSVPLVIALVFATAYVVFYPTWSRMKN